ncbi:transporter [Marinobacter sp. NFXS9]|uniref:SphA family protein n=1 Tax=Marinobacter sp. NFXS9 TaxID=2818433 RepID=UPI0032E0455C
MNKALRHSVAATVIGGLLFAGNVNATESGGSVYPLGVQTVMPGVMFSPGNYLLSYNTWVHSNALNDNDGHSSLPNAELDVEAHALRYLHIFEGIDFAGANVGFEAAAAYTDVSLEAYQPPYLDIDANASGIGDLTIGPSLGWHGAKTHQQAVFLVTLPSGTYDEDNQVNVGRNYTALQLSYGITHFMGPLELSALFKGIYNFENHDTNYKSGAETVMDYGINFHFRNNWFVGVGGYWHQQLTDDEVNGESVGENGNRIREFTIGPKIGYGTPNAGVYVSFTHEVYARNASNGNQLWINPFIKF